MIVPVPGVGGMVVGTINIDSERKTRSARRMCDS
jgi:hypothetical protein